MDSESQSRHGRGAEDFYVKHAPPHEATGNTFLAARKGQHKRLQAESWRKWVRVPRLRVAGSSAFWPAHLHEFWLSETHTARKLLAGDSDECPVCRNGEELCSCSICPDVCCSPTRTLSTGDPILEFEDLCVPAC